MTDARPDAPLDVRLVVSDLDGTLLDGAGRVPEGLWPLLERMQRAGIVFAPASGRQHATLLRLFDRAPQGTVMIAENGTYVVRDGVEISSAPLAAATVATVLERVRGLAADGRDLGLVVCGKDTAYLERTDRPFRDQIDPYYAAVTEVPDLAVVDAEVIKLAVFDFGSPLDAVEPALAPLREDHQVVVSGAHWVDVMRDGVHKGVAVRRLQESLGVTRAQTVVFGDYLNDLEMLDEAEHSYAMADAHPDLIARARHRAPSNQEQGVLVVLEELLAHLS